MLKALLDNQIINLAKKEYTNKRSFLKSPQNKDRFICPYCQQQVVLNWAVVPKKTPYFSHKKTLNCIYEHQGETEKHRIGKTKIYEYLKGLLSHKIKVIDLEYFIPETGQIADIFIEYTNGIKWVIEYQRSNISPELIQQRRNLYKEANIRDIWIVGENLITPSGIVTYSVKRAAEVLITNSFDLPTLTSYNPETNNISIYRGLNSQNSITYTLEKSVMELPLEESAINLWGQFFSYDDYEEITYSKGEYPDSTFTFRTEIDFIKHSKVKGYDFSFPLEQKENNKLINYPFKLNPKLKRLVPVEMKDITLKGFWLFNHSSFISSEEEQFIVKGISKKSWVKKLEQKQNQNTEEDVPLMYRKVNNAMLMWAIDHIYTNYFQTAKEFQTQLEYLERGRPIPFYTKNYWYKKHKLIKEDFSRDSLTQKISLEDCLSSILYILEPDVIESTTLIRSIQLEILLQEELKSEFNLQLLERIIIRSKKHLKKKPDFHNFTINSVGLFVEKD